MAASRKKPYVSRGLSVSQELYDQDLRGFWEGTCRNRSYIYEVLDAASDINPVKRECISVHALALNLRTGRPVTLRLRDFAHLKRLNDELSEEIYSHQYKRQSHAQTPVKRRSNPSVWRKEGRMCYGDV